MLTTTRPVKRYKTIVIAFCNRIICESFTLYSDNRALVMDKMIYWPKKHNIAITENDNTPNDEEACSLNVSRALLKIVVD